MMSELLEGLFYHKNKVATGQIPTIFQRDKIPNTVRNSILTAIKKEYPIWKNDDMIYGISKSDFYKDIELLHGICLESFGVPFLLKKGDPVEDFLGSLCVEEDVSKVMTYIELLCRILENKYNDKELLDKINWHLRNNGVGYKYIDGNIIPIEDEIFSDNVTQPVLSILSDRGYTDTLTEFLKSYEELKQGNHKDAVTACTKALETILKTRLDQEGKLQDSNWAIRQLLVQGFQPNVNIPSYMQNYLNNLTEVLQASATVRNKDGAHGSEEGKNDNLDEVFVRYTINQAAASILFIAECEFK